MADRRSRPTDEQGEEPPARPDTDEAESLDELDAEIVEDLDADDEADDIQGASPTCITVTFVTCRTQ